MTAPPSITSHEALAVADQLILEVRRRETTLQSMDALLSHPDQQYDWIAAQRDYRDRLAFELDLFRTAVVMMEWVAEQAAKQREREGMH
jgi:hypothetical protein